MKNPDNDLFASISSFLHSNSENEIASLADEQQKERAQQIAARENAIAKHITDIHTLDSEMLSDKFSLYSEVIDFDGTNKISIALDSSYINNEEVDHVILSTLDKKPNQSSRNPLGQTFIYFPQFFEIDTLQMLQVGYSTDASITSQAHEMIRRQEIIPNQVRQFYLFDVNGQFGHVSCFPRSILDNRPDIGHNELALKHVPAPMRESDFDIVELSLSLLENALEEV